MVLAVSNTLGHPVMMFSSAHLLPLVYTTPGDFRASTPLYVAFNQAGAGHYDAVTFKDTATEQTHCSHQRSNQNKCTCGQRGKHYSTAKQYIPVQKKYTSMILCPCLAANRPCTSSCICNNCDNPNSIRPRSSNNLAQPRQRQRHAW